MKSGCSKEPLNRLIPKGARHLKLPPQKTAENAGVEVCRVGECDAVRA